MFHADRGIGLVDVLAAGTGRTHRIDFQIFVSDLDLDLVVEFRQDFHRGKRGMSATGGIKR